MKSKKETKGEEKVEVKLNQTKADTKEEPKKV